jgi:nitroimidazol reductase NimA-like FMN-containing flavoprotein (pyridoxamine 5'-phosphate oxidase superfamily)
MSGKEPLAELQPQLSNEGAAPTPWREAQQRLEEVNTYWLATVRPNGRPHVVPLLAVWMEGALYFSASPDTRKARNLSRSPHCVLTAENPQLHLVVEGIAEKVSDPSLLQRVAGGYAAKYGWLVEVRDGAFYAEGAPTAGPPPYEVYRVKPVVVLGFGTDGTFNATRWQFWE